MIPAILLAASLNVFGPGSLLNVPPFARWDEQAVANASAHAGWSLAVPLGGCAMAGRKGALYAALGWVGLNLIREAFFHGNAGGPEVRTDLLTHIVPAAIGVGICAATTTK